jgi:hypothetical protein
VTEVHNWYVVSFKALGDVAERLAGTGTVGGSHRDRCPTVGTNQDGLVFGNDAEEVDGQNVEYVGDAEHVAVGDHPAA